LTIYTAASIYRLAMKRAEERGKIRAAVEGSLTKGYDSKRRKGERPMNVGAVRCINPKP
jgi:hypothetical protein